MHLLHNGFCMDDDFISLKPRTQHNQTHTHTYIHTAHTQWEKMGAKEGKINLSSSRQLLIIII